MARKRLVCPGTPTYNRRPFRARPTELERRNSSQIPGAAVAPMSLIMAWNQPGGQNNPWGRRPGQGGGPDLDERVKSWQRKLESLLRPGGKGGEGGSLLLVIGAVVVALWLASGFFQVKAAERGVILRFGKLIDVRNEGWGWRWPW